MKKFLCVFTGTPELLNAWQALPEAERQARQIKGMAAWKTWIETNAAGIVEIGGPLGKTKFTSTAGVTDIRNNLGGFTIVKADSHDAAARMFIDHPHFAVFPGAGVEVMEILPTPGG